MALVNKNTSNIVTLNLVIDSKGWLSIPNIEPLIKKAVRAAIKNLPSKLVSKIRNTEITVLLTTNHSIQQLNHDFRGMDKPTNVLSFPQFEKSEILSRTVSSIKDSLGDIAIAYQYVKKEARLQNKSLENHLTHLVIHGFLHLLGFDHISNHDAKIMESLEIRIMHSMRLANPYHELYDSNHGA